jgi:hypothetical protein
MRLFFRYAALTTAAITTLTSSFPLLAATYDEKDLEQMQTIAVAAPYGQNKYNLLVIEQIPGKKQCWSESGSSPTIVEPLLLTFDFTGNCNRSTDSNGYSIRIDSQDYGLDYLLRIVERNGELVLVGTNRKDSTKPEIVVGKTYGVASGYLKIFLNPGWRFTKRVFQNKTLGHFYFSGTTTAMTDPPDVQPGGGGDNTNPPPVSSFKDINNDIYKSEIEQAVAFGFIAGFKEDNTFRPDRALTREQLVSMVIDGLKKIPNSNIINVPDRVNSAPYKDVDAKRWSAAKIEWAKNNKIVTGYPDGNFQPTKAVTRAELIAVLTKTAKFAKTQRGLSPDLTLNESPMNFSDISKHWGGNTISQMSAYCKVASPVNETGMAFAPDSQSNRNYAAAATLRMFNCVKAETK